MIIYRPNCYARNPIIKTFIAKIGIQIFLTLIKLLSLTYASGSNLLCDNLVRGIYGVRKTYSLATAGVYPLFIQK